MNLEKVRKLRIKTCKGCTVFNKMDEKHVCSIPHKINGHFCPCSICLVKPICIDVCDKLHVYMKMRELPGNNRVMPTSYYKRKPDWWKTSDPSERN